MYAEAPDAEQLAEHVLDEYGEYIQDVYGQNVRIKYLSKDSKKSTYLGKCSKATGKWKHLVNQDFIIEIFLPWWKQAKESEKKALLFHELKHIQMVEKETEDGDIEVSWKIRKHDVELFTSELELFGGWRDELKEMIEVCKEV